MITLFPPAKSLNFSRIDLDMHTSIPDFEDEAYAIVQVLRRLSKKELKHLMKISDALAEENVDRFKKYSKKHTDKNGKPALFAYDGATHKALSRDGYGNAEFTFMQQNVRIISGLYGVLRPMDLIQPYRLEMARKVSIAGSKNLYDFWEQRIARHLNTLIKNTNSNSVLNVSSKEYARVINPELVSVPVVSVEFYEKKDNGYRIVGVTSKTSRGKLVDFIIRNKISSIYDIKSFTGGRYVFDAATSTDQLFVFREK